MTGGGLIFAALFVLCFFVVALFFAVSAGLRRINQRIDSLEERLQPRARRTAKSPPPPPADRLPPSSSVPAYKPKTKAKTYEGEIVEIENYRPSLEYRDGGGRTLKVVEDGSKNYGKDGQRKSIVEIMNEQEKEK